MRPPLPALPVPSAPPLPEPLVGEEGEFVPPSPADPANPSRQEVVATAMALMTALGVAAAQGMWHRARHRQALADQSRAAADKASAKAATASPGGAQTARSGRAAGSSGRSGGSVGSSLLSPGGDKKRGSKGSRAFARRTGDGAGGSGPDKVGKGPRGPKRQADGKAAKRPQGRRDARGGKNRGRAKGAKDGLGKGRGGWLRRATGATGPGGKPSKPKRPKDGAKEPKRRAIGGKDPSGSKGSGDSRGRKLTWKAPKTPKDSAGKGGSKGGGKGPKRWSGRTGTGGKDGPGAKGPKRPARSWARKVVWANSATWWKRWRSRRAKTGDQSDPTFAEASAQESATPNDPPRPDPGADGQADRDGQARTQGKTPPPPPPPPPGWERMRPPPAADRTVHVTVERVDEQPWPRSEAAALTVGQAALPAGPAGSAAARPAPALTSAPHHQQGARFVSTPVARTTTQYADADLTIYDVIDADADMAEEITEGIDEARAAAEGCERLLTKLEALHAKVVELKVPGVLAGMVVRLMEKTGTVQAKAEAIAAALPRASEAISTAGTNAEARHRHLADVTRDMGHIRPAERDYHDE
ncbi:hypothetical protein AB0J28_01750 [Streptosporangium canum]|uniref:hypothetical protein n=1 Tax=Streptosporangium canum TaxID=324952 RepID=UPI00344A2439